jgi:zinc D-Ala-D-Ala dipeptidase
MRISVPISKTWLSSGCTTVSDRGPRAIHTVLLLAAASWAAGCASVSTPSSALSPATTLGEAGLVDIRSLVPDMAQQIQYAGPDNFVGTPVQGYGAARCYLTEPAAQALQRVERSLRKQEFRLQVFDCYRPTRAVAHFVRWAGDPQDQRTKGRRYPNLDKSQLLGEYIAPVSGHSRGATVDLTLLDCRGPSGQCAALDMGTEFDFFDPRANTDSPQATPSQRENRQRLLKAMAREGFTNYPQEWWHYTLSSHASQMIYDIPIE